MKKTLFLAFHTIRITLAIQLLSIVLPAVAMEGDWQSKILEKGTKQATQTLPLISESLEKQINNYVKGSDKKPQDIIFARTFSTPYKHFPRITFLRGNVLDAVALVDQENENVITVSPSKDSSILTNTNIEDILKNLITISTFNQPLSATVKKDLALDVILLKRTIFDTDITHEQIEGALESLYEKMQKPPPQIVYTKDLKNSILSFRNNSFKATKQLQACLNVEEEQFNFLKYLDAIKKINQQKTIDLSDQPPVNKKESKEEETKEENSYQNAWLKINSKLASSTQTIDIVPQAIKQTEGTITETSVVFQTPYKYFPSITLNPHLFKDETPFIEIIYQEKESTPYTSIKEKFFFKNDSIFKSAQEFTDAVSDPYILIPALVKAQNNPWKDFFAQQPTLNQYYIIVSFAVDSLKQYNQQISHVIRVTDQSFTQQINASKWSWLTILWYKIYHGYTLLHLQDPSRKILIRSSETTGWLKKYRVPIGLAGLAAAGAILYKYRQGK